jgi:PAS domain S-box-containing protein
MQSSAASAEYQKFILEAEDEDVANDETSGHWVKKIKYRVFGLFYKLNKLKIGAAAHYHMLIIAVEALQFLTLVMLDGNYTKLGPYGTDSPWNLEQTQWFIDICWVFRIDHYFRINFTGVVALLALWGLLITSTIGIAVLLAWDRRQTAAYTFLTKVLKGLITLLTDLLFIPIMDTFAFGIKCSQKTDPECLGLAEGYIGMVMFTLAAAIFLALTTLCSIFYYDFCQMCGDLMAKPHSRFKLVRLALYVAVIFCFYFITTSGKVILYLVVCIAVGVIELFIFTQYLPYYSLQISHVRLSSQVAFLSAAFCMLIGEFFNSTDATHSSVTMLFYFLTPCLIQITHLAISSRGRQFAEKKVIQLTNPYQVEIKARMLISELHLNQEKKAKAMQEADEQVNLDYEIVQTRIKSEVEMVYSEAFRKFPHSELLYLWSGLFQMHFYNNNILAMVQCFKGLHLASKLDTQYMLYEFRRTSETIYKTSMKDDAYDYVMFEKCFANAQRNDEAVTRSQFYFWAELESKQPKIDKLTKISSETARMIKVAKSNYQRLLKLNSKSSSALRMYGHFLASLNNYSDVGQRYLQKAEMQEDTLNKTANVVSSLTQPLSFFDTENLILSVSADLETIGEIQKVNGVACSMLGYLQAELVGRNISLLIPPPFAEDHDQSMRRFHEIGVYSVVDNPSLLLYFLNKSGLLFEARLLVKVVPSHVRPPFFLVTLKPTNPHYEVILMNSDLIITGFTQKCTEYFEISSTKGGDQKFLAIFPEFNEHEDEIKGAIGAVIEHEFQGKRSMIKCRLEDFVIGKHKSKVFKFEPVKLKSTDSSDKLDLGLSETTLLDTSGMRPISILQSLSKPTGNLTTLENAANFVVKSSLEGLLGQAPSDEYYDESYSYDSYEYEEEKSSLDNTQEFQSADSITDKVPKVQIKALKTTPSFPSPSPSDSSKARPPADARKASLEESKSDDKSKSPSNAMSLSSSSGMPDKSSASESSNPQYEADFQTDQNSKSMNSSMASVAQFNKSMKALVLFEYAKTKKHTSRFKIALLLTIIVLIVTSVITFGVISTSVAYNKRLSHYVNLVGDIRHSTQSLPYYTRQLFLIDSAFTTQVTRDEVFAWMEEEVVDMHDNSIVLYKDVDLLSKEDVDLLDDEDIATWFLEGSDIVEINSNMFDAAANFILQGYITYDELKETVINFDNRRVFYIFRNGNADTLKSMNKSAKFYETAAQDYLVNQRLAVILLILASVFLLILCAVVAIFPAIRIIEKSQQEVWEIFFEIPPFVSRVMKAKCADRLTILNETANIELEDQNPEEIVHDEVGGEREHLREGVRSDEEHKKKSKAVEAKSLAYDPRQRRVRFLKLACFFGFSLGYFYLIYYVGFGSVTDSLKQEPVQINWASRRKQLSRSVNMWVNEALFTNITGVGWQHVVPSAQNLGSPLLNAEKTINELEFVENSLIFGNADEGIHSTSMRSQSHDDLLFQNACLAPVLRSKSDCETVGNKAMIQGLHSAIGLYITLARSMLLQIKLMSLNNSITYDTAKAFYHSDDMVLLRDLDNHYLYDPLAESSLLYESDFHSSQTTISLWQNVLMAVYCASSVLFYFFMYRPMVDVVGKETKNSWSMCTLIPQEYQEEFKKLNQAIKERKDNFK